MRRDVFVTRIRPPTDEMHESHAADMQETLNEPLYVDRVHYTAGFSRRIAEEISKRLFEREPFVSRSPH